MLLSLTILSAQEADEQYLWLEEVEAEKALEWAKARNESTLAVLRAQADFDELYNRGKEILNSNERIAYPSIQGRHIYNFWQDKDHVRGIWRRTTPAEYRRENPGWEILLDIDALCQAENEQWVYKGASGLYPDYEKRMVQLSRGGGDAVVMREFDVKTRSFVENGFFLPEAKGSAAWMDQNTLLISTSFGENTVTESGYPRLVKIWKRGTDLTQAETVFEGEKTDVGCWGGVIDTPERRYDLITRSVTFFTSRNYILEEGRAVLIDIPEDAQLNGFFKKQMLVELKSDWSVEGHTYKQGALIAIDFDAFMNGSREFDVIFRPDERSSLNGVSSTLNYLILNVLNNVRGEMYRAEYSKKGWQVARLEVPELGSLGVVSSDENSDRFFYTFNGYLTPNTLYFSDFKTSEKIKQLPAFFDASGFVVEQFEAVSKDDTKIPYFVVHNREMKSDGSNPTLLYGYGGFEVSINPGYSPVIGTSWLEKGGVYVEANIRGGGEFGPKWHQSALKENRQRAYDDFIAVAEDLITRKITSPQHLGIRGGSNGGLLMGVMTTQRPDLFNAVVCAVPLLDMKRYNKLLAGASWMAEYGNPDLPEEWTYISKYSPFQNLKADAAYPQVFFYTSTRDDRVHPGHARKMVAKMTDMGYNVLYYENMEGGHAAATTNEQRAFIGALTYSYLLMKLK